MNNTLNPNNNQLIYQDFSLAFSMENLVSQHLLPQSICTKMPNSYCKSLRHETEISDSLAVELVRQYHQTDALCTCFTSSECKICADILSAHNLEVRECCCQVCNADIEHQRSLPSALPSSTPPPSNPLPDAVFGSLEEIRAISLLKRMDFFALLSFKTKKFDYSKWTEDYTNEDSLSRRDVLASIRRPPGSTPYTTNLEELDILMFELVRRDKEHPDFLRGLFNIFEGSRLKIVNGYANKKHRSSGSVRRALTAKAVSPLSIYSQLPRRTTPLSFPAVSVAPPPPRIAEFIFKSDHLYIGDVMISDRKELLDPRFDIVFGRDKSLRRTLLNSKLSLESFQATMSQKVSSDRDFRRRLEKAFPPPVVTSSSEEFTINLDDSEFPPQLQSGPGRPPRLNPPALVLAGGEPFSRSYATVAAVEPTTPTHIKKSARKGAMPFTQYRRIKRANSADIEDCDIETEYVADFCDMSPTLDITNASQYVETLYDVAGYINQFTRLAVTINLAIDLPSMSQKYQVIYLYLSSFSCKEVVEYFVGIYQTIQFQSGPADKLLEDGMALIGVANVLALFSGAPTTALAFMHQRFVTLARRSDGDDLLKKFYEAFKGFLKCLEQCWKTGSIDPLFSNGSTPSETLFEGECLITYRMNVTAISTTEKAEVMDKLRKAGRIPSYWTRPFIGTEYIERLQEVIKRLDVVIPLVDSASRPLYISVRGKLNSSIVGSVNSLMVNSPRIQPLGVAIVGKPGTGKSVFTKNLHRFIGLSQGYAVDGSGMYSWQLENNFQDTLNPGHWHISCDDIDHNTKVCAPGVKNHVDVIMSIGDNKPMPVESAHVDQKGNNCARPLLFTYGSNNVNLRLATFSPEFSAVWRRLPVRLTFRAHPDYRQGAFLDSAKAMGNVDVHEVDCHVFDKATGEYTLYKENMTTTETLKFVLMKYRDNLENQNVLLSGGELSECCKCFIPLPRGMSCCDPCRLRTSVPISENNINLALDVAPIVINPPLQGGTISHSGSFADNTTKAVENLRNITDRIQTTELVDKADRVLNAADRMINAPSSVSSVATKACESLSDFVRDYGKYVLIVGAITGIITQFALAGGPTLQGRVNNSTQEIPVDFVRVSDVKPNGVPFKHTTYTDEDLIKRVRQNLAKVHCGDKEWFACRVGTDLFISTSHDVKGVLGVTFRGIQYDVVVSNDTVKRIGTRDLVLIKVPGVPVSPNILPMIWQEYDASQSTFDKVYLVTPTKTLESAENRIRNFNLKGYSGPAVMANYENEFGFCGLPLVAVSGSAHRIIGFHHAGDTHMNTFTGSVSWTSYAPIVSRGELTLAAASLAANLQSASLLSFNFPKGLVQGDLPGPTKSELSLALSKGVEVVCLGHDVASVGHSATKSKCKNSLLYLDVEPRCRALTNQPHYWQVPVLKGKMIDGSWRSGYQGIFDFSSNNEHYSQLYYAINDYCSPFPDLDVTGFAALSMDEAIRGVESSIINPVNLKTSVGPPLVGSKRPFISHAGYVHPTIEEQIAQIELCLKNGDVPIVVSTVGLKDEPIKHSKNAVADIRTINCMPASFNLVTKQYFAPIKAFMRAYPFTFESMVGINMAQDGGQLIYERFKFINPDLDNIVEGDFKKMDKTIDGSCAWAVTEVFCRIAEAIGIDPSPVRLLTLAQFNVIYSIHGDLYQVGAANPSGCDITVEINAIVNSLTHRAAWYSSRGMLATIDEYNAKVLPPPYREEFSLVTYGDDFLEAHRSRIDIEHLFSQYTRCGMIVTDGQKLAKPIYRSFWEVSFLKRNFFIKEGFIRCGLNVLSIFRMLMISKPTDLSAKEQAAICCEEALREVFLNSSLNFDEWREFLKGLADKHSLWDSAYLQLKTYDQYETMWASRTFTTWCMAPQLDV